MKWWTAGAALLLVTSCTSAPGTTQVPANGPSSGTAEPSTHVPELPKLVLSGCGKREHPETGEVRAVAKDAEVWALLFAMVPFRHGRDVKIVWRMTGAGPLKVTATLPDGTRAKRTFGPEEHGGSTWERPGEEWGTGFNFPQPGCWRLTATRTVGSGYIDLPVK